MTHDVDLPMKCKCTACDQERIQIINERRAARKEEIILARQLFQTPIGELAKRHNLTPKTVRRILKQGGIS